MPKMDSPDQKPPEMIHVCMQAPPDKHFSLIFGRYCPFCGEELPDAKTPTS